MKTSNVILFLLIVLSSVSCHEDESLQPGKMQFSFTNVATTQNGGRKQTDVIPDGSTLLISILKNNGDSVFTMKKIELLKIGDTFISSPVALPQGNYVLSDFLIVGANNTVLFAAPKTGSPLAGLVRMPLPVPFSVHANAVANTQVEVVDANAQQPADFGYASFDLTIVPSSGIAVSVFTVDGGNANFTSAQAYVVYGTDTVLSKPISPAVNNLYWNTTPGESYTLSIIKDGFGRYTKRFVIDSLTAQLHGQPLAVILEPALTILWSLDSLGVNDHSVPLEFSPAINIFATAGSKFHVEWGDGVILDTQYAGTGLSPFAHTYRTVQKYFITITGDLSSIKQLNFPRRIAKLESFSIQHLPNLEVLHMVDMGLTIDLDLSRNTKLTTLELDFNTKLRHLDISNNPLLFNISITGLALNTATTDTMIDDLYDHVVASDKRSGVLFMQSATFSTTLIGPPSPAQVGKLHSLVDHYGWLVSPVNF